MGCIIQIFLLPFYIVKYCIEMFVLIMMLFITFISVLVSSIKFIFSHRKTNNKKNMMKLINGKIPQKKQQYKKKNYHGKKKNLKKKQTCGG